MAAALLGRRIRIIGPVFDEGYINVHRELFRDHNVEFAGELGGAAKTAALNAGRVRVYSCARHYVEAGAAVFGESLRAGTPVAALTWRQGTCAHAALCDDTGAVATAPTEIYGNTTPWQRREVQGITLRVTHDAMERKQPMSHGNRPRVRT
jgi:hypothetical protein